MMIREDRKAEISTRPAKMGSLPQAFKLSSEVCISLESEKFPMRSSTPSAWSEQANAAPDRIFAPAHWDTHCFKLHNYHIFATTLLLGLNAYYFCSWTSLVAQLVKHTPVSAGDTRDTGSIPSGGDPMEKETATRCSILVWRIPWTEDPGGVIVHGLTKSWTQLSAYTHVSAIITGRPRLPHTS